jgi:hypothetical protein
MRAARIALLAFCTLLGACGSCSKEASDAPDASSPASSSSASVVAEPLPRCRKGAEKLPIQGEDVIVGDVAIGPAGLLAGVTRRSGGKHVASVLRTSLQLGDPTFEDVGTPIGDDPPPSPRWNGGKPWVAYFAGRAVDGGTKQRELVVKPLGEGGAAIRNLQQSDESTAFDVAWSESGTGLIAWDEDAPFGGADGGAPKKPGLERGVVKVQALAEGATAKTISPDTSDADSPHLVPRAGGGFWLAWLARKPDEEASGIEGPGEPRQFRWVEVMALDAKGESAGPVRRVGSEKGRAVAFELARSGADLVVMVQDEIAASDGTRILRHKLDEAGKPETNDIVKDGVGHALADLVPSASTTDSAHWLAWSDTNEHTHLTQLGPGLVPQGKPSSEPTLEGARVLASSGDALYALSGLDPGATRGSPPGNLELLRFVCP